MDKEVAITTDIDGFFVSIHKSTTPEEYEFGTDIANEQTFTVAPESRRFVLFGIPSNQYYTFNVQLFQVIDEKVEIFDVLKLANVKSEDGAVDVKWVA